MASIDLCVYGTPHGFDSFEVPKAMGEYCEQFYRTNRRGRMLMANRRNDGSTVYSFLVYNLVETDLRQHAFFGTSFTLHGDQYIPDLQQLYNVLNDAFDRHLVGEGLFLPVANTFKYSVAKFKEKEGLIDKYLNSLMSLLSNFETEYITKDFKENKSGQIALCNIETSTERLTQIFTQVQWLAISPVFQPEDPQVEVDLGDINKHCSASFEQIADYAIHKNSSDKGEIEAIINQTITSLKLLMQYASQGNLDNTEIQNINNISSKLNKLLTSARALKSQFENDRGPVAPPPKSRKFVKSVGKKSLYTYLIKIQIFAWSASRIRSIK